LVPFRPPRSSTPRAAPSPRRRTANFHLSGTLIQSALCFSTSRHHVAVPQRDQAPALSRPPRAPTGSLPSSPSATQMCPSPRAPQRCAVQLSAMRCSSSPVFHQSVPTTDLPATTKLAYELLCLPATHRPLTIVGVPASFQPPLSVSSSHLSSPSRAIVPSTAHSGLRLPRAPAARQPISKPSTATTPLSHCSVRTAPGPSPTHPRSPFRASRLRVSAAPCQVCKITTLRMSMCCSVCCYVALYRQLYSIGVLSSSCTCFIDPCSTLQTPPPDLHPYFSTNAFFVTVPYLPPPTNCTNTTPSKQPRERERERERDMPAGGPGTLVGRRAWRSGYPPAAVSGRDSAQGPR